MIELIKEGGFIMVPLLICSLLVWAVVLEKYWSYYQFRRQSASLHSEAINLVKENRLNEARGLYIKSNELIAGPHLTLFDESKTAKKIRDEKVGRRLAETEQGLKKYLWILGTIATSAPFIGLFGTVVGIIKSFESIAEAGKSGFSVVAAGLSEALIATAAGILVAVIASMFYNYFLSDLVNIKLVFKNKLEDLSDEIGDL